MVPGPVDHRRLMVDMELQILARRGFQADHVVQPRLAGEGLEQGRHAADALCVQIRDGLAVVMPDRRIGGEGEAVADEEDGVGACARTNHDKAGNQRGR